MNAKRVTIAAGAALLIIATSAVASAASGGARASAGADGAYDDLATARRATAEFRRIDNAVAAEYGILKDAAGIACIANLPTGTMGIHYVKGALVGDATVNIATPEALVYELRENGKLRLVAVEYVVFQGAWDAVNSTPPSLFGRQFTLIPAGNRYGLPPFYELHAWIWEHNPSGMFADWNPRVTCVD